MIINDVVSAADISGTSNRRVVSVLPDVEVREVARLLAKNQIGILAVCDSQGVLLGVLSERDIIRIISEHDDAALGMKVETVMTRDPQSCTPDEDPMNVINIMSNKKFRHMPVIKDGKLVGMVSSKDIFSYLSDKLDPAEQARLWTRTIHV